MKLRAMQVVACLLCLLSLPSLLFAEESSFSFPFNAVHVRYEHKTEKQGASLLRASASELFIDVESKRIAYELTDQDGKTIMRKVFAGGYWYTLLPFTRKYEKVKSFADPLLELFSAHMCAPYPKLEKYILGKKVNGCKMTEKQQVYFWHNIMLEQEMSMSGFVSLIKAIGIEVDKPIPENLFTVSESQVAKEGEIETAIEGKFSSFRRFVAPGSVLRAKGLARRDPGYQKLMDQKKDFDDWSEVLSKSDALDLAWARSEGWNVEEGESFENFVREKSGEHEKESAYYTRLADEQHFLKNFSEAEKNVEKAIEKNPYEGRNFSLRGALRAEQERYDEALRDYDRALRLDVRGYSADRFLESQAGVYCRLKECEKALKILTELIHDSERQAAQRKQELEKLAKDAKVDAPEMPPSILAALPADLYVERGDVGLLCGKVREAAGDFGKAAEFTEKVIREDPSKSIFQARMIELLLKQAHTYAQLGEFEKGLALLGNASSLAEKDAVLRWKKRILLMRFYLHRKMGRREQMLEDLRQAEQA